MYRMVRWAVPVQMTCSTIGSAWLACFITLVVGLLVLMPDLLDSLSPVLLVSVFGSPNIKMTARKRQD